MEIVKTTEKYYGYVLQEYAESFFTHKEIKKWYKKLYNIPKKISAVVDKATIKSVYKYTQYVYFIIDTDDKVFILKF